MSLGLGVYLLTHTSQIKFDYYSGYITIRRGYVPFLRPTHHIHKKDVQSVGKRLTRELIWPKLAKLSIVTQKGEVEVYVRDEQTAEFLITQVKRFIQ